MTFDGRFMKSFSLLLTPITEVLKSKNLKWTNQNQNAFETIREILTSAPILALPNYTKEFEIEYSTSSVGIGVV